MWRLFMQTTRRLKQMLVNLLSNAVKFTPAEGSVGLQVKGDAGTNIVRFTVWDTGIGIAEKDMDKLFQPFVQLDTGHTRQYGGTGLGLVLVARIGQVRDGDVSVESQVDRGSRFTITLPWYRQDVADTVVELHCPSSERSSRQCRAPSSADAPASCGPRSRGSLVCEWRAKEA